MPNRNFNFSYNHNRPKLGLKIEDTEKGERVKVLSVEEGSAADKAGIKKDDIIIERNGEKINDVNDASE
ncbi:MAG: PDZ domain-containing protein [Bacteroidota bacterium]|nr:PDZ domain-containing protein [Bacteroidota bacterium]